MSLFVLDASVAVKWYVEEPHSEHALRVLGSDDELIAPVFMPNEVASAFLKKVRRGEMRADIATAAIPYVVDRVRLESLTEMVRAALDFAITHDRSIFDSLYVLLAIRERCPLLTADERLYNALHARFAEQLLWIEDYPPTPV